MKFLTAYRDDLPTFTAAHAELDLWEANWKNGFKAIKFDNVGDTLYVSFPAAVGGVILSTKKKTTYIFTCCLPLVKLLRERFFAITTHLICCF